MGVVFVETPWALSPLEANGKLTLDGVQLVGEHHRTTLPVVADSGVVRGCVVVFLGSSKTAAFGADAMVTINPVPKHD